MSSPTNCSNEQEDISDSGELSSETDYESSEDASSSMLKHCNVLQLDLFRMSEGDHKGIFIKSIYCETIAEKRISLKLNHSNNFGFLQLRCKCPRFDDYFPPDATVKMNEILLQKSSIEHNEFSLENLDNNCWDPIHIITKNESDCNYLFIKAIKDKYTVILAIQFEVICENNSSHVIFYPNSTNGTPLHRAALEGDVKVIETLLSYELDINECTESGWTPLLMAANSEMSDAVDLLISNGADVNFYNDQCRRPLHYAARGSNSKILDSLLKSHAKIDKKDDFGETPLHWAVDVGNVDAVDILLKKGANCKLENRKRYTPFHRAIENLNLDIVEVFFKNNVDVQLLNTHGQTPIFYISKEQFCYRVPKNVDKESYSKIIKALVQKGANINFQDLKGYTPLHYAVINDNVECVQALLECNADASIRDKLDNNLFHLAGRHEANKCIPALLNINIDINAINTEGKTVLHTAVEKRNYNLVELILTKNPNIDKRNELGQTALHLALDSYNFSIIELLLKNKADVNLNDSSGKIALHLASENHHITVDIIKSILNSTNDIDAKDNIGRTPVHYAALNDNINTLDYLLEANADVNAKDFEGETPLHLVMDLRNKYKRCLKCVKTLLAHKANINAVNNELKSPLHLACFTKNAEDIKYLIENGADCSMKDEDGKTAFHYACIAGSNDDYKKKYVEDILNVLIEENLSVNCVDKFGGTPLLYAVVEGSLFMNQLLLDIGADINIINEYHFSPFHYLDKPLYRDFNDDDESKELYTIYKQHIVKMQIMKLWVREEILDKIYKVDDEGHLEWIQRYESVCAREIDVMKITNLDDSNITYYDFLKKSQHNAINYARNPNVVKVIQSNELTIMFPIYGHFLKCHLCEVQRRSNLYDQIQELLKPYIFKKLPTLCMYEILRYLDHSDLVMFLKAIKPVVLVK